MEIMKVKSRQDSKQLSISAFDHHQITQLEFVHLLKVFEAIWEYPGKPDKQIAHAITKAGKHSSGFVNCLAILKEPNICELMAMEMVRKICSFSGQKRIDWIISVASASIDLGHDIARIFNATHGFVEKDANGNPTIWRHNVPEGETAVIINELMTTNSGSTYEAKMAVLNNNPTQPVSLISEICVLVNRSGCDKLKDGTPVTSVFNFDMPTFDPGSETCPYCAVGSPAYKPKKDGNWEKYFKSK